MSFVSQDSFLPGSGISELTLDEQELVMGGNRGSATAGGAVTGAAAASAAMVAARYASFGARIGVVGGGLGIVGGAVVGGLIGFVAYELGKEDDRLTDKG